MFLDWNSQYCENDHTTGAIYRFSAIPTKLSMVFLTELEQKCLLCMGNTKAPNSQKAVLRERNRAGGIRLLNFRLYYKTTLIKAIWYWPKTEIQINGMRWISEVNPCLWSPECLTKGARLYMERRQSLQ